MERVTLSIEGMNCGHCVKQVSSALSRVPGVVVEEVSVGKGRVAFDPTKASVKALEDALSEAGYSATIETPQATRLTTLKPQDGGCCCG